MRREGMVVDWIRILIIRVPDDPVLELCYPRVHAGPVAVSAPDSPADDPGQLVPAVPALDHHGAARVALARVLAAVGGSRADEDARYPLVLTRAAVHCHALRDKDGIDWMLPFGSSLVLGRKVFSRKSV